MSKNTKDEFADIDDKTRAVFTKKGYELQSKLGAGAFGLVYKARNFKKNNQLFAVKVSWARARALILHPLCSMFAQVMDMTKMSSKLRDKFLPRELAALMEVKHPNAVRGMPSDLSHLNVLTNNFI